MKRLFYTVLMTVVIFPLVIWAALWVFASTAISEAIGSNLQGQSFDGVTFDVQSHTVRGFPTALNVELLDFEAASIKPALRWHAPLIQVRSEILHPNQVKVSAPGEHDIHTKFGNLTLIADTAEITARLVLNSSLPLGDIHAVLDAVELRLVNQPSLELGRLTAAFRRTAPAKYTLEALVDRLVFTDTLEPWVKAKLPTLYQKVENLEVRAALELDHDLDRFIFNGAASPRLTAINGFNAHAKLGEASLFFAGDFSVDEQGRIDGPLRVRVENWELLHQVALESGLIAPDLQKFVSDTLHQWSQMTPEENVIELPLRVKNGLVSFGMFNFGLIPEIALP